MLLLLCCAFAAHAANLTENFESGLPTSASSSETKVTLTSGQWTVKGVYGNDNNGSKRARFDANGYLITPALDRPGTVKFSHRSGGSGKTITVEKSTDGGTTWTEVGVATTSSASAYGSSTFSCNSAEADTEVLIRFTSNSGSVFMDDVTITLGTSGGGGGGGGGEDEPVNPEPQPEIEWTGPHSVEHCIYVAPWALDDTGDGSWEHPLYNLQIAVDRAQPGDTIYVRGGTYYPNISRERSYVKEGKTYKAVSTKVYIETKGTPDKQLTIKTFPGEFPVLNFDSQKKGTNASCYGGIYLLGDYWNISGLHITLSGDNGMKIEGSHNKVMRCTFSYNDDTGLQLGFGHHFEDTHPGVSSNNGTYCSYNDIIDCDSYLNYDSDNRGSDADGFACKMHNGIGNRFIRCRAWHNADDAWDLYETDYAVKLIECWAWSSAFASDFSSWAQNVAGGSFQGNGNGIKLGGNGEGGSSKGTHEAWFCVVFDCQKTGSVKGFDQNSHGDGIKLVNCLAFDNGNNYSIGGKAWFYNCVSVGEPGANVNKMQIGSSVDESNNAAVNVSGWSKNAVKEGFSKDDYYSLAEEDAKAPRAADGSLPTRFARLKPTSVLIGKGKDMTEDLKASFPDIWEDFADRCGHDIGPYDYASSTTTGSQLILTGSKDLSLKVVGGSIQFTVPADGKARVDLYSPQGTLVSTVANLLTTAGGQYSVPVSAQLQPGIYIARLTANGETKSIKFTKQ